MSLRTRLTLAFAAVVLLAVGASLFAADHYLARTTRAQLSEQMAKATQLYAALDAERTARRVAEARVVAEEPRLKAVVRTTDIDQATLEDVADEMRVAAGADVFLLTDRMGTVVANVSELRTAGGVDELSFGDDVSAMPGFAQAARSGDAAALWAMEGSVYRVTLRQLRFGTDVSGFLVLGHRMGEEAARETRARTGAEVLLLVGDAVVAHAVREGVSPRAVQALAAGPDALFEREVDGERFIVRKEPHPGLTTAGIRLVLAGSLDQALSAHGTVRKVLFLIGVVAALLALAVARVLARGLTRRLEALSFATQKLAQGQGQVRVDVDGSDEIAGLGKAFNSMASDLERSRAALIQNERLEQELEIAQRIQTALQPPSLDAEGFRIAAASVPAEHVGGDYYDFIPVNQSGFWLCVGDVTSHGVTPGLIMMMARSGLTALVANDPLASPKSVLTRLNQALYLNVHERMKDTNYMTAMLMRHYGEGEFRFSGAHLDVLIRRADGALERVATSGVWLGVLPDIEEMTDEQTLWLAPGDTMVLYTDGITEARSKDGRFFDIAGLESILRGPAMGAQALKDEVLRAVRAHMHIQADDMTLMVVERRR